MARAIHRITRIVLIVGMLSLNVTYAAFQMGLYLTFTVDETVSYNACEGDNTDEPPIASIAISKVRVQTARGDCQCLVSLYSEDRDLSPGAGVTVQAIQGGKYNDWLNYNATGELSEGLTFHLEEDPSVLLLHFEDHTRSLTDYNFTIFARDVSLKLKCQPNPFQTSIFTTTKFFIHSKAMHETDNSRDFQTSLAKDLSTEKSLVTDLSTEKSLVTDLSAEKSTGQSVSLILILLICGAVIVFMLCTAVTVRIAVCLKKRNRQDERNNVETVNTGPGPTDASGPNDDTDPGTEYVQVF